MMRIRDHSYPELLERLNFVTHTKYMGSTSVPYQSSQPCCDARNRIFCLPDHCLSQGAEDFLAFLRRSGYLSQRILGIRFLFKQISNPLCPATEQLSHNLSMNVHVFRTWFWWFYIGPALSSSSASHDYCSLVDQTLKEVKKSPLVLVQ